MTPVPSIAQLGFGTASIGNLYHARDDDTCRVALDAAWSGGIRYYDTAPHYGLGLSERRLGSFLAAKARDEFVISTKVGRLLRPNPAPTERDSMGFDVAGDLHRVFDPSLDGVRRSLEESLDRLGLDRVDILFLHDPDVYDLDRGLSEGLPALAKLREEGLVQEIGVGVNSAEVAARAIREGDLDVVMVAGRYSLLDTSAADDLLPLSVDRGVRVVDAAVFNSGLLATATPGSGARFDYGLAPAALVQKARDIADVCAGFGVELPAAALQWPLRNPAISTVVVGTARPDAVAQNIKRFITPIPDGLWLELDRRVLTG